MNTRQYFAVIFFLAGSTAMVTPVSAQILYEANFDTNGDFEGWVDFQNRLATSTVAGGVWSGVGGANNDPQLRTAEGTLSVDMNGLGKVNLQIRAKNGTGTAITGGASYISFLTAAANNTAGLPVVNFNFTPTAPDTFELFNVDVKSIVDGLAGTDGVLRSLRLDLMNDGPLLGKTFELDYVRLVEIDPGDANLDGFVNSLDFELISDNLFNTVAAGTSGDITGNGVVDYADYRLWRERNDIQVAANGAVGARARQCAADSTGGVFCAMLAEAKQRGCLGLRYSPSRAACLVCRAHRRKRR